MIGNKNLKKKWLSRFRWEFSLKEKQKLKKDLRQFWIVSSTSLQANCLNDGQCCKPWEYCFLSDWLLMYDLLPGSSSPFHALFVIGCILTYCIASIQPLLCLALNTICIILTFIFLYLFWKAGWFVQSKGKQIPSA